MITQSDFQKILDDYPAVESVLLCSRNGLILESSARTRESVEAIASIVANLFSAALESAVLSEKSGLRLLLSAEHGSLYIREQEDATLICIASTTTGTEQIFESILAYIHQSKGDEPWQRQQKMF